MPGAAAGRDSLLGLLQRLQTQLQSHFDERSSERRHRRSLAQRRALLGLELLCKLEEQILNPALQEVRPRQREALDQADREIQLMRDLSLLATHTVAHNRTLVLSMLDGMLRLHLEHLTSVLRATRADALPWAALEQQMRAMLGRWSVEVEETGDVEDEERDPVGLPPR